MKQYTDNINLSVKAQLKNGSVVPLNLWKKKGSCWKISTQNKDTNTLTWRIEDYDNGHIVLCTDLSEYTMKEGDKYYLDINEDGFYCTKGKNKAMRFDVSSGKMKNDKTVHFSTNTFDSSNKKCASVLGYMGIILVPNEDLPDMPTQENDDPVRGMDPATLAAVTAGALGLGAAGGAALAAKSPPVPNPSVNQARRVDCVGNQVERDGKCVECGEGKYAHNNDCVDCPPNARCGEHKYCKGTVSDPNHECVKDTNGEYKEVCKDPATIPCGGKCPGTAKNIMFNCVLNESTGLYEDQYNWWWLFLWIPLALLLLALVIWFFAWLFRSMKRNKIEYTSIETDVKREPDVLVEGQPVPVTEIEGNLPSVVGQYGSSY